MKSVFYLRYYSTLRISTPFRRTKETALFIQINRMRFDEKIYLMLSKLSKTKLYTCPGQL